MKLFVPTHRDLIRVAIFALLGALVLPLFPGIAFTGGVFGALGIGVVFACTYLFGGSAWCYFSRMYAPKLENLLPASIAMYALTLIALTVVIPFLALGLTVAGIGTALIASAGLTFVAGLSTIMEPRG